MAIAALLPNADLDGLKARLYDDYRIEILWLASKNVGEQGGIVVNF